jgi:hypothetical protein
MILNRLQNWVLAQQQKLKFYMAVVVAVLITHWLAELWPLGHLLHEYLVHHLDSTAQIAGWSFGAGLLVLLLFFALSDKAHHLGEQIFGVRALNLSRLTPHETLVFVVSSHPAKSLKELRTLVAGETLEFEVKTTAHPECAETRPVRLTANLAADLDAAASHRGYKLAAMQLLRGFRPNLQPDKRQRVYLISSEDSAVDAIEVKALLQRYSEEVEVMIRPPLSDFDAVDALCDEYEQIIQTELHYGTDPQEILLDVTGGTKAASIAGILKATKHRIKTQYVPTDWHKPPLQVEYILENRPTTGH